MKLKCHTVVQKQGSGTLRKYTETITKGTPKVIQNHLKIEPWALKGLIFYFLRFVVGLIFDECFK